MESLYTILYTYLKNVSPLSEPSFIELSNLFKHQTVPKEELFIKRDKPNRLEYILIEGVCRNFVYNPQGEEITIDFYQGKAILSPHITRTIHDKSILYFQALTSLQMVVFDAQAFVNLMIENLEVRDFGNTVLKNELLHKVEKEIGLASLSAKERLFVFRKQYRMLENLVPHPHIASYLGITNISLSRLRGELARE
jgi:CRP-like cAMP-binding protein